MCPSVFVSFSAWLELVCYCILLLIFKVNYFYHFIVRSVNVWFVSTNTYTFHIDIYILSQIFNRSKGPQLLCSYLLSSIDHCPVNTEVVGSSLTAGSVGSVSPLIVKDCMFSCWMSEVFTIYSGFLPLIKTELEAMI